MTSKAVAWRWTRKDIPDDWQVGIGHPQLPEASFLIEPLYASPPPVQPVVRAHKFEPIMDGTMCCQYCMAEYPAANSVCEKAPAASHVAPAPRTAIRCTHSCSAMTRRYNPSPFRSPAMTSKAELAGRLLEYKASHRGDLHELLTEAAAALTEAGAGEALWKILDTVRGYDTTTASQADVLDDVDRIASAALTTAPPPVQPVVRARVRHKKRGTEYEVLGVGKMQTEWWRVMGWDDAWQTPTFSTKADMREVTVYRSVDDGSLWVRPREEFEDGRFEALTAPPSPAPGVTDAARFLLDRLRNFSDAPSNDESDDRWHFSVLPAMRVLEAAIQPAEQPDDLRAEIERLREAANRQQKRADQKHEWAIEEAQKARAAEAEADRLRAEVERLTRMEAANGERLVTLHENYRIAEARVKALEAGLEETTSMLDTYVKRVPVGHQPHMMALAAEERVTANRALLDKPGGEPTQEPKP